MIDIYIQKSEGNLSKAAHTLLFSLLQEKFPDAQPWICTGERGKPYLTSGPFIGLSHAKGYLAVAFGDIPFGLDLEYTGRKVQPDLADRVFSPCELQWFAEGGRRADDFFTLWTLKESYYKYLGLGLPGFPNHTGFYYDLGWKLRGSPCNFDSMRTEKLRIAVCSYTEQRIRYFFL